MRGCVLFPRLFANILPVLCSLYNSIMNILSLLGLRNTFGALWEGNIPYKIRHIWEMETNITNNLFVTVRYWCLFPCPSYALFQMICSLSKVLQTCSLIQIRIPYQLWNCANCMKLGESQQEVVWVQNTNVVFLK